ncbi:hypothetical protein [Methanopyrus sp. KOL6]|uniref:hypothetical protein n=1 Tax=Methanopyrus sp. KOL6 TaxID=1937004 RepID=UPI0012FCE5F9|nr:hypothetical protein [Methanopyrus sp. KOL6]
MTKPVEPDDPRIRLLLAYVNRVKERAASGGYSGVNRRRFTEVLRSIESTLQELRYSYLPPEDVSERLKDSLPVLKDVVDSKEPELRWLVEYLEHVDEVFEREIRDESDAVLCVVGEVGNVREHPDADNLYITVVNTGRFGKRTVVTNLTDVEEGDSMSIALLPPREFSGVVSEGMFCGEADGEPGEIIEPPKRGEVRSIVLEWIEGV